MKDFKQNYSHLVNYNHMTKTNSCRIMLLNKIMIYYILAKLALLAILDGVIVVWWWLVKIQGEDILQRLKIDM